MSTTKRSTALYLGLVAVALLAAVLFAFTKRPPEVYEMSTAMVLMAAAIGLNLATGYTHQISLAHGAFLAVGAYTAAILVTKAGVPQLATLPAAAAVTFLFGLLVGLPTLRLRGLHLTLVTIALAVALGPVLKRASDLTGGLQGIFVDDFLPPSWLPIAEDQFTYFTCLAVVSVLTLISWNLMRGGIGRAVRAVAQNELAAAAMGIDTRRIKLVMFAWSAMFAGIAGWLYMVVIGFVQPDGFSVLLGVYLLVAVVVGGPGMTVGPLIGGLFIQYVPVWAGDVSDALAGVIYGVALIIVLMALPTGIAGGVARLLRRLRRQGPQLAPVSSEEIENQLAPVEAPARKP